MGFSRNYSRNQDDFKLPNKTDLIDILDGLNAQKLVETAENIAKYKLTTGRKKVSTSQIRNIYGTVKKLELEGMNAQTVFRLVLLKPKLAYAVGRNKEVSGMRALEKVLCDGIDLVCEREDRFMNFCRFFEAILAYHKFYGGN